MGVKLKIGYFSFMNNILPNVTSVVVLVYTGIGFKRIFCAQRWFG